MQRRVPPVSGLRRTRSLRAAHRRRTPWRQPNPRYRGASVRQGPAGRPAVTVEGPRSQPATTRRATWGDGHHRRTPRDRRATSPPGAERPFVGPVGDVVRCAGRI